MGELRKAVLGATAFVLVVACEGDTGDSARSELGRTAELPGGSSGRADSPSGQSGAPVAWSSASGADGESSTEVGSGGTSDGADATPELDGGQAGAGGEPAMACDRVADIVPTTCPGEGASGPYRETGLGFLEVTGWEPNAYRTPWAPVSGARAINAAGDVVGYATLCDRTRAILYRAGTLLELDPVPGALSSFAWDINDEGEVLGEADGVAFVWKNGVTTVLSGFGRSSPVALNNVGQIVGLGQEGPFIWDAGLVTRLGLDRNARVTDINDRGQVTGYDEYSNPGAFVWEGGVLTPLPPLPGGGHSRALAINEAGQIVGSSVKDGIGRAVRWDSGAPVDITPPTDYALVDSAGVDINEHGVVLGYFQEDGPRRNSAGFVVEHGLTTRIFPEDPTVGAALSPYALNDAGEIAGITLFSTGSPNQATVWSRACFGGCCE